MVLPEMTMDPVGRKLVNLLQEGLPLEKDPYGILARELGVSREEVASSIPLPWGIRAFSWERPFPGRYSATRRPS